jgi:DNA-binding MarR family transcriptional regulator
VDVESDQPDEAVRVVRRGVIGLARRLRGARGEALSPAKIGILGYLARHGPSSPGVIAAADGQRQQALTRVFAELDEAGMVSKSPSSEDRRGVVLSLTEVGRRALDADLEQRDRWLAGALATLSDTERGVLALAAPLLERLAETPQPAAAQTTKRPR